MAKKVKTLSLVIGPDNDIIVGGREAETLSGLGGDDSIYGGYGADTIDGGDGNDLIVGGNDADILTGGAGADTFRFDAWFESSDQDFTWTDDVTPAGVDTITDLSPEDSIALPYYVTDMSQVEIQPDAIVVHVVADDPRWDMRIEFTGVAPTESQFILG